MDRSHRHGLGWSGVAMLVAVAATHSSTVVESRTERATNEHASLVASASRDVSSPARVTFEQIYFSKATRGADAFYDAFEALREIRTNGADPARFGDPCFEERWVRARSLDSLAAFGPSFYPENLPLGVWSFPVESPQGFHLVRVTAVEPARAAATHGDGSGPDSRGPG